MKKKISEIIKWKNKPKKSEKVPVKSEIGGKRNVS